MFIALIASIAFSALLPPWIDLGSGENAYLRIDKAQSNSTGTIVIDGTLITQGRITVEHVMDTVIALVIAGFGIMFLGIGLIIIKPPKKNPGGQKPVDQGT